MAVLAWCVRRLRRGVPTSAWSRAGACAAGDALCRKLLDTAPVGLALVRCSDRSLLLSNGLAWQWVCSDSSWFEHAVAEGAQQARRELVLGDGRLVEVRTTHTSHAGEPVVFCLVSDVTALRQAQAALVDSASTTRPGRNFRVAGFGVASVWMNMVATLRCAGSRPAGTGARGAAVHVDRRADFLNLSSGPAGAREWTFGRRRDRTNAVERQRSRQWT